MNRFSHFLNKHNLWGRSFRFTFADVIDTHRTPIRTQRKVTIRKRYTYQRNTSHKIAFRHKGPPHKTVQRPFHLSGAHISVRRMRRHSSFTKDWRICRQPHFIHPMLSSFPTTKNGCKKRSLVCSPKKPCLQTRPRLAAGQACCGSATTPTEILRQLCLHT